MPCSTPGPVSPKPLPDSTPGPKCTPCVGCCTATCPGHLRKAGSMDNANYPIPKRLNLAIAGAQLTLLLGLFWMVGQVESNWAVATLALFYSITMNSAYAMLHEAEHGILHPHPIVNDTVGVLLALFFPAPFHLQRQGHLGHHMRNRSDDEAFDFYFAGDNVVWKYLQLYGILSGFFWLVIALANVLVAVRPALVNLKYASF